MIYDTFLLKIQIKYPRLYGRNHIASLLVEWFESFIPEEDITFPRRCQYSLPKVLSTSQNVCICSNLSASQCTFLYAF